MEKIEVAKNLAKELWATERALDAAIAQAGDFVGTMIDSRRELKLSAVVGADAQTKVMEAMAALAQARASVVAAHGDLAALQRTMRVDVTAFGDEIKPEGSAVETGPVETRRLRVAS